jgi:hypothetical protein
MKVQAEFLEIVNFLLTEFVDIESISNIEEIDIKNLNKLQRPIKDLDELLKLNGFNPQLLKDFCQSKEVEERWKGETDLIDNFHQAVEKDFTIGDFCVLLYTQDPKFLETNLDLISPSLSERSELLALAGGKMNQKGYDAGIGTCSGIIFICLLIAYRTRNDWVPEAKELYLSAKDTLSKYHKQIRDYFISQEEQEIDGALGKAVSNEITAKFNYKDFSKEDMFELAEKAVKRADPELSSAQIEFLNRQERDARSNPEDFLEHLTEDVTKEISPKAFIDDIIKGYNDAKNAAEDLFVQELNKMATKKIRSQLKITKPKEANRFIDEYELKRARNILLTDAKEVSKQPYFEHWYRRHNMEGKAEKFLTEYKELNAKLQVFEDEHSVTLNAIKDIEIKRGATLKDLEKQAADLTDSIEEAEKIYGVAKEIRNVFKINYEKQALLIFETENTMRNLKTAYDVNKKIADELGLRLQSVNAVIARLDDKISDKSWGKRLQQAKTIYEQGQIKEELMPFEDQLKQNIAERDKLMQELEKLNRKDDIIDRYETNSHILNEAKIRLNEIKPELDKSISKLVTSEKELAQLKKEFDTNQNQIHEITQELGPLYKQSSILKEQIIEVEKNIKVVDNQMNEIISEFETLSRDPDIRLLQRIKEKPGWDNATLKAEAMHNVQKADDACEVFNICQNLDNSITTAKSNTKNELEKADADAFKNWLNTTSGPKLKEFQRLYGSQITTLIKDRANITDDLPDIENAIVREVTQADLEEAKIKIANALDSELNEYLDLNVKAIANKTYQDLLVEEADFMEAAKDYMDNAITEIDNKISNEISNAIIL